MGKYKIGLLVIATGKYDEFIPPLFKSMKKHFFKDHDVTMFVFSDKEMPKKDGLVHISQQHEGWPYATLKRYHVFDNSKDVLSNMDYLFYCDADMLFVSDVGEEILPDELHNLVGTLHPGFYQGNRGTYESNYYSLAFVSKDEGQFYFAGGFNGGTSDAFLKMSSILRNRIDDDLKNNIIAVWHDESHLNRYFVDNSPKVISPSYCYPENWNLPFEKKILALNKNHNQIRN